MAKYKASFYKRSLMIFVSHLDLMTLFKRAIRRSALPFVLTKGFTPRVKISMPKALKLGVESDDEEIVIELEENIPFETVKEKINHELPDGVKIKSIINAD